uniref:Uncharacterized protein n=1 Tax=Anguilla anguilla TaxID=7936 RepID=A0A0E9SY02_ANGAN
MVTGVGGGASWPLHCGSSHGPPVRSQKMQASHFVVISLWRVLFTRRP